MLPILVGPMHGGSMGRGGTCREAALSDDLLVGMPACSSDYLLFVTTTNKLIIFQRFMLLTDRPFMDFMGPEVGVGPAFARYPHSVGLGNSPFSDFPLPGSDTNSPFSVPTSSSGSPAFLSGVDCAQSTAAAVAAATAAHGSFADALGTAELSERLHALLALQASNSPQQSDGLTGASISVPLSVGGLGSLPSNSEARELLALQAALGSQQQSQQNSPSSRLNGAGNSRTGPVNNPLYKTELCRSWEEFGSCRYGSKCQFAHGREELRPVQRHPKYKTEMCRTYASTGTCPYGTRCRFIHQSAALAQLRVAASSPSTPQVMDQLSLGDANSNGNGNGAITPFASYQSDLGGSLAAAMAKTSSANSIGNHGANGAKNGSSSSLQCGGFAIGLNSPSPPSPLTLFQSSAPVSSIGNGLSTLQSQLNTATATANANAVPQSGGMKGFSPSSLSPITPPAGLFISTHYASAPNTPHGPLIEPMGINGVASLNGVRRTTSDNSLSATATGSGSGTGTGTATATPTSARRLPIFSTLAEEGFVQTE